MTTTTKKHAWVRLICDDPFPHESLTHASRGKVDARKGSADLAAGPFYAPGVLRTAELTPANLAHAKLSADYWRKLGYAMRVEVES